MENNKKKKTTGLLLSILGVLSLVLITAGVTYAFFNYAKEGQTVNTIRTGTIEFAYTEVDGVGHGISITNAMPTPDSEGKVITVGDGSTFRFKIESKTPASANIPYVVTLRKTDGLLADSQIKVYLEAEKTTGTVTAGSTTLEATDSNYTYVSNAVQTFGQLPALSNSTITASVTPPTGTTEKIMYTGTVPVNQSSQYTGSFVLRMWLNNESGTGSEVADYSPFEFMLKSAVADNNPLDAEAEITAGNFITSTAYYALPATATPARCEFTEGTTVTNVTATYSTLEACEAAGTGYAWIPAVANGQDAYDRIVFVNNTNKTFYTVTQAKALNYISGDGGFGNYTLADSASLPTGFDYTEQYYRINGANFTAIVNVYADGQVVTP